jgi:hypothetical protein
MNRLLAIVMACLVAVAGAQAADLYRWGSLAGNKTIAPSTYIGPGDVVNGATAYFGLRAYNRAAAVAGTNALAVRNSATNETCNVPVSISGNLGAVAGCSGSSTGDTLAVFCAESAGHCLLTEVYDQTGNGHNLVQATTASQPDLSLSCLNSLPCMQTVYSSLTFVKSAGNVQAAADFSMMFTAERTGHTTSVNSVFCDCATSGANAVVGFGTVANSGYMYAGVAITTLGGVPDNQAHAAQVTFIGFGSSLCFDGTCTGTSPGSNVPDLPLSIGTDGNGNNCDCNIFEAGLWPLQFSATQIANMCANQYAYWGTATACTTPTPSAMLLENGTDFLLLESGGSNVLCLEGAC